MRKFCKGVLREYSEDNFVCYKKGALELKSTEVPHGVCAWRSGVPGFDVSF